MSLLRADRITNRYNNTGPIIVGPSTVHGDFIVTGDLTVAGIAVTNSISVGAAVTAVKLKANNLVESVYGNITGVATINTIRGATYFGVGNNITGVTTLIRPGSGIVVLSGTPQDGGFTNNVSISARNVVESQFATEAGVSTNLVGGDAGKIPYQTAADTTAFTDVGTAGQILQSQGTAKPIWTSVTAINVAYADSAGISTNLKGGSAGRIPYQTGIDATGFLPIGSTGKILLGQGTVAPIWIDPKASLDVRYSNLSGIATNVIGGVSSVTSLDVTGISTLATLGVTGVTTTQFLEVTGVSTFNDYVTIDDGLTVTGTGITVTTLKVTGFSTFTGFATFGSSVNITNQFYSGGISSVGASITMYPSTGIVSATAFYGDGSNITGISSTPIVTNILYVTTDGDDINNDGNTIESAKRTVGAALTLATTSTVIKVSAGNYFENNPLIVPEQVSIQGDSLREVSLSPQNSDEDFIYVSNGDYIDNISFTGTLDSGKAVIAFNPNKPSYINQGPYIRNCTNFIANSIGMKIDGNHAIGDTKSMSVDSYTQYNQGGIGVSVSNEGYAQLVSIFTICTDQSIVCINGGACDLTNSNSSFGRLGLVADGVGPQNFIGTVTTEDVNSNTFTIDVGVNTLGVTTAAYDNITGILTVTTDSNHGFNVGKSIEIRDLEFSCNSGPGIVAYPSGNYGYIFTVDSVETPDSFSAYVGVSTLSHNYERSGVISEFISRPYDGQVAYFDELYNSISGVTVVNGGNGYGNSAPTVTFDDPSEPWGIRATGVANLTNGSVTSIDILSSGRGYTTTPNVTFGPPPSGTTATGTVNILPTYYVVSSATPIVNGITTVTFTENVPYTVGVGTSVPFFKQSRVLASSHAFEYIGSGNTIGQALPQRGGVGIQENEIISQNGGLVVYTSTDQAGNFRIGDGVIINQLEGSVSGQAYERSLFANITPYILALGGNK